MEPAHQMGGNREVPMPFGLLMMSARMIVLIRTMLEMHARAMMRMIVLALIVMVMRRMIVIVLVVMRIVLVDVDVRMMVARMAVPDGVPATRRRTRID